MTDPGLGGESALGLNRFEDIYRENFPFVWAAAHRCGVPHEAVEDVVQDVFVTAHRRMHELDWEVSARGWLYGVTRHVAMRHRRGVARRARREALAVRGAATAAHPHRRHEAAHTLDRLLQQLGPRLREVFEMAEILGMSGPEIAAELGVPANTVYSRLRLARRKLKALADTEPSTVVEATRREQAPTAADRKRVSAALLPLLNAPWWAAAGLLKAGLAGLGLAGTVAAGVALWQPSTPPVWEAGVTAQAVVPVATPSVRQVPAAPAPAPSPAVEAVAAPPPAVRPRKPARPPTATPDPLSEELAMLDRAQAALRRGDATEALQALDAYDARFPHGQLQAASRRARCRATGDKGEKCSGPVTEVGPGGER